MLGFGFNPARASASRASESGAPPAAFIPSASAIALPPQVQSDSVRIKSQALNYERRKPLRAGGGDPIVMLHPWFGCTLFWDHTVEAIPERETLVIDLYSLGGRPGWEEFASPQGLSRAVEGFADALQLERFCLVGNSMGGIAAQEPASRLDGRISKLLLVGTGARIVGVKPDWRKAMDAWITGEADRSFTEHMVAALLARRPERKSVRPIVRTMTLLRWGTTASASRPLEAARPSRSATSGQRTRSALAAGGGPLRAAPIQLAR